MLTTAEIKKFIEADAASAAKKNARVGLRYYEGDHDINQYRIFFFAADGTLKEDKYKSNIRISHPFFSLLVDQQVQYMLSGKGGFVRSDTPELQTELDAYFNESESFAVELAELIKGAIIKGSEYMYAYKGEDGKTAFQTADSLGVVEVRDKETDDGRAYLIYHFVDRVGKDNKEIKRIQVWDDKQTYFYCQIDDGEIKPDDSFKPNPRPHILYQDGKSDDVYYDSYGEIPFFRLDNGKKKTSGVAKIKTLIDDYDLMNAGLSNNIQDTNEALYVVRGFHGDNLDEIAVNLRSKKMIGVDEEGSVEIKTVDIPTEARKVKMEVDEKNIFRFGQGVNTEALKDTSATTSIAIKSAYANLDLKCDGLMPFVLQLMRNLLSIVLKEINDAKKTDYRQRDVYFDFSREIITNAAENAQIELLDAQKQQTQITTILNAAGTIGDELTAQLICEALDIDYDDIKDKLPKPGTDPYQDGGEEP